MEVRDWISIVSALIIAIGWFVTGYLNRAKDISQKRLEYRLKMLESFLPVWFAINEDGNALSDTTIQVQLKDARYLFAVYGLQDEHENMEQLFKALKDKNLEAVNKNINELVSLVRFRICRELQINR